MRIIVRKRASSSLFLFYLTLSVMRMLNGIRIQTFKLIWPEKYDSFAPADLSEEIFLFIIVAWCYITWNEVQKEI